MPPGSSALEIRLPGFGLNSPMSSKRLLFGIGSAILLAISAASIALDVKSRSEKRLVYLLRIRDALQWRLTFYER